MNGNPTELQLEWQKKEMGMFCHFGINTFYGKEWSDGTLDPAGFNPKELDARQWVATAKEAGMKYMVFTTKHHDGFCLWPTETTDYSVKSSPWKNGKGDVVGELCEACREMDMPMGLYLSPWDRHEPCYADKEAYDKFYIRQLTELCTKYGELFEIWLDGAGSEGRVYDWVSIMEVKEKYQPQAMVFNMGKPTIRWVGNENGLASDPCYYAVKSTMISAFTKDSEQLDSIEDKYLPPECDVPIRSNWFWQPDDLHSLKTLGHLMGIYYRSVGYGANLLLNVPPDRRGLLDPNDSARLREMAAEINKRFANPIKGKIEKQGKDFIINFGQNTEFDHLVIKENIPDGQKIDDYGLFLPGSETPFAKGVTVGHKKINVFSKVNASKVILKSNSENAVIDGAEAFLTGHEKLPELGAKLDYEEWAHKADPK